MNYRVPRFVLKNLFAQFYGVGTKDVIFRKFSIEISDPQKNVPKEVLNDYDTATADKH